MRDEITQFDRYLQSLGVTPSKTQESITQELKSQGKWGINIGPTEAHILQWLIRSFDLKKVLEIGTQFGASAQWMLEALPLDGQLISLEKDPQHHQMAEKLVQDSRAQFLCGDALELLPQLQSHAPFDLVFIDANKKAYPQYLEFALKLLRSGGILVADNTLLFGHAPLETPKDDTPLALWQAMREFNRSVFEHPNLIPCFLPTPEGLVIATKR